MSATRLDTSISSSDSTPTESKEEKKSTTSQVMHTLLAAPKRGTFCEKLMGTWPNPHIYRDSGMGQLFGMSMKQNGLSKTAHEYFNKMAKSEKGVAQTWIFHTPTLFVSDPALIQQIIKFNESMLLDIETGGIQEFIFGSEETENSLERTDPRYRRRRELDTAHLLTPIADLAQSMHQTVIPYIKEISESKGEVNLEQLAARIAITTISKVQLGLEIFPEADKIALSEIIHEVATHIANPLRVKLLKIDPQLNKLVYEGAKIIKKIINLNKVDLLVKLKSLLGDENLTLSDLNHPWQKMIKLYLTCKFQAANKYLHDYYARIALVKLFIIGGSESTAKLLLFSMLMLGDPKNKIFVDKIRKEIAAVGKPLEEFTKQDLDGMDNLCAFVYEVLRLFPPFSHMRHTVKNEFSIAQDLSISADKQEYIKKLSDSKRDSDEDILLPQGSIVITSTFDAHRSKMLYGEDASIFNPDRWLGKKFDLRDVMHRSDFFTFGKGPRSCPGRLFSEQEARLFLLHLIANFDIKHNLKGPLPLDVGFTLEMKPGVKAMGIFTPNLKLEKEKNEESKLEKVTSLRRAVS